MGPRNLSVKDGFTNKRESGYWVKDSVHILINWRRMLTSGKLQERLRPQFRPCHMGSILLKLSIW